MQVANLRHEMMMVMLSFLNPGTCLVWQKAASTAAASKAEESKARSARFSLFPPRSHLVPNRVHTGVCVQPCKRVSDVEPPAARSSTTRV